MNKTINIPPWSGHVARALTSMCVCALAWLVLAESATANGLQALIPTVLHMDPIAPVTSGESFTVTGIFYRHVADGNAGIPHRSIKLYIKPLAADGAADAPAFFVANVFSNAEGRLRWVVHKRLDSGLYRLYFLYQGSPTMRESMATTELQVLGSPVVAAPNKSDNPAKPAKPVKPAKPDRQQVALNVTGPAMPVQPGDGFAVTAQLVDANGAPMPDYNLYLHVPGAVQQRTTDAQGKTTFYIRKPLSSGEHVAVVSFAGRGNYASARQQVAISVNPPATTQLTFVQGTNALLLVGDDIKFIAQLSSEGRSMPNEFVRFFVNGVFHHGATTNSDGFTELRFPRNMPAGTHVISATYRATVSHAGSTAAMPVTLSPRTLELHTVPPLAGVRIRVGNNIIETDMRGIATTTLNRSGAVQATVLPYESPGADARAEFNRWSDGVLSTTRKLRASMGPTTTYQLGFEVSHPVVQLFVEQASGREVVPGRLSRIMLVNSAGEVITVSATGTGLQWLKANRIIRLEQKLVASPVSYQLRNVTVDGVNVVNEGQQRFKVEPNARWTMRLQMHDLEVEVRDALFGTPMGQRVRVAFPGGEYLDVNLDPTGRMRLNSLSRGSYILTVQGAQGIQSPMPIALSRNREVNIAVISYLDMAIVGGATALLAMVALLIGRRKSLPRLQHHLR